MNSPIFRLLFCLILFPAANVFSQQHSLADLYLLDKIYLNPAYTGTTVRMPVKLSTRQQWAQLNQGPSTQAFSIHKRIRNASFRFTERGFINRGNNSRGNVGLGGFIFNDKSGAMSRTGLQIAYAYHIPLENARLSSLIFWEISKMVQGCHLL